MISLNEIRDQLVSYLAKEKSFAEFEDWLIDHSWDMHKDSSESAQELVHEISASIYEYLDQNFSEEQLRVRLRPYVQLYRVSMPGEPAVYRATASGSVAARAQLAYG